MCVRSDFGSSHFGSRVLVQAACFCIVGVGFPSAISACAGYQYTLAFVKFPRWCIARALAIGTTTDLGSECQSRNLRARRQRARRTIRLFKVGSSIGPARLDGAVSALADHHATRGSDPMTNGRSKNGSNAVNGGGDGGFTCSGHKIKQGDWR